MSDTKVMNRWLVVVGAILIQLCLGAIYAWSVFTKPLVEAGWTKTQTQMVFSAGLALFAIVMVIAGRMMRDISSMNISVWHIVVCRSSISLAVISRCSMRISRLSSCLTERYIIIWNWLMS